MERETITALLEAAADGDVASTDELFKAVYDELRKLAKSHRRRWQGNETINTTVLIHEAFLKLAGPADIGFENHAHFVATASRAMRQVLVDYAEQQKALKRGGDAVRVPIDEATLVTEATADELLDLHNVLCRLENESPRRAKVVECRSFGGMSIDETAIAVGISPATVKREWQIATARLYQYLHGPPGSE